MTSAITHAPLPLVCTAPPDPVTTFQTPARFPSRDAVRVRLERTLRRGLSWKVPDLDEELADGSPWSALHLTLSGAADGSDANPDPRAMKAPCMQRGSVTLRGAHGDLRLPDDRLIALLTGVALPPAADTSTRDGLLNLACALWPTSIADALGGALAVATGSDIGQETLQAPIRAALTLIARDGSRHTVGIEATAESWSAIAGLAGWVPMPLTHPLPPALAAVTLPMGLHLGRVTVSRSTASRLRVGDALWLPADNPSEVRPLCFISGRQLLHLGQVNHLSREFQGWGPKGGRGSNSPHALPPPTEPRNVDALTVDLDFIVGRVALTVGELSALAPGHVIELESTTPAHVRIVAHGTELGSGQLVDVDGRLAIEILQWGSPR
ncbi:FliM/FliN family flagellar motor switch protein [Roseateles sp. So40a]|uniref:FliM/FliN family flagellar motor switch protein n=1 Tax=Roseateles sp. So40a TaxID=3400226 RepID=UPI003A879FB7